MAESHTFAADNFTDNNDALVQRGLLDVNYFYISNGDASQRKVFLFFLATNT
jgi:hypothetical protein